MLKELMNMVEKDFKEFVFSLIKLDRGNIFSDEEFDKFYKYFMENDYFSVLDLGSALYDYFSSLGLGFALYDFEEKKSE